MRDFTLTESVCDQAVIVKAVSTGWIEWFSNPTAGPWKRIGIPGISSLDGTGFEKEETRPDLVLYHNKNDPKILILESKDNIGKLIDSSNNNDQLKKTCKVFSNISTKLENLIKKSSDKQILKLLHSANYICGYLIGYSNNLSTELETLKKLHFKFIDKSKFPFFVIITVKKSGFKLIVETEFIYENNYKGTKLKNLF